MSSDDQATTEAAEKEMAAALVANLERTVEKCQESLVWAERFFAHQSAMNAASHLSTNVLTTPILSHIRSTLQAIEKLNEWKAMYAS